MMKPTNRHLPRGKTHHSKHLQFLHLGTSKTQDHFLSNLNTDTMDSQAIVQYMDERIEVLQQTNPTFHRTSFTFENPHTCQHCQQEAIQIETRSNTNLCFECMWSGVGKAAEDERHRRCGGCSRLLENPDMRVYSATLSYSPSQAIGASQSGCAFYELLVDDLLLSQKMFGWTRAKPIFSNDSNRFMLSFSSSASDPHPTCTLSVRFGPADGTATGFNSIDSRQLEAWTTATSKASRYISSRPYERDVTSSASINFAQKCLKSCLETHYRCRGRLTEESDRQARRPDYVMATESVEIADIPSRLLHIPPDISQTRAKLVQVRDLPHEEKLEISQSGFAVLSYCWGGSQPVMLTTANLLHLTSGFDASEMAQTIRDAMWVAQEIGQKYLWVDALCILQDDGRDKEREIARMGKYYGGATVTICAASASTAREGFLSKREARSYAAGPIRLPLRSKNGDGEGEVFVLTEDLDVEEPTTTRGWTLQESLLSRRILIFTQKQIYWCCVNSYAGCGGMHVSLVDRFVGGKESLVENIYPMGSMLDRDMLSRWILLVEQYTKRRLGFEGDKLLAFSAVAADSVDVYKGRGKDVIYLAGLLVEHKNQMSWLDQLLWYPFPDIANSTRAKGYRAPSWSWVALDGRIAVGSNLITETETHFEMAARVEAHHIDLSDPKAPYGSVLGGHLTLWAKVLPVRDCMKLSLPIEVVADWTTVASVGSFFADPKDGLPARIELFPDTKEDQQIIEEQSIDPKSPSHDKIQLVCLFEADAEMGGVQRVGDAGLIVAVCPGPAEDTFSRIGLFRIRRDLKSLESSTGGISGRNGRSVFDGVQNRLIQIV